MKQQLLLQQQQQTRPHISPDEFGVYRRILYINKTILDKVTVYDFQSEFHDISSGITYRALHNIKYLKQIFFSLREKGYIVSSKTRTKPQGYYAKEYEHVDNSTAVTLDMTHIDFPSQLGNSSSNSHQKPLDISELLNFGIHDIQMYPHVKGSHKKFLDYGLKENSKKHIYVGKFHVNNLDIKVRSSNKDTLMIYVATSKNQIMLNTPPHLDLFDQSLDKLIDILSITYGIDNISHHDNWIIKMWHYAADYNVNEASNEKFHVTWKDAKGIFNRRYTKIIPSQNTNTRIETQELPNLTKKLAIQSKQLVSPLQQHSNNRSAQQMNGTFKSISSVSNNAAASIHTPAKILLLTNSPLSYYPLPFM